MCISAVFKPYFRLNDMLQFKLIKNSYFFKKTLKHKNKYTLIHQNHINYKRHHLDKFDCDVNKQINK